MFFNSILVSHKITYGAVMKKTHLHLRCPFFKGQGGNATALRRPCLPPSAVIVSLHNLPRCLR